VAPSSVELCKNNRTKNQHSNRVASGSGGISGSQGFLFSGTSTGTNQNRNNRPPGTIGETIRKIVSSAPNIGVPQAVHDIIGRR